MFCTKCGTEDTAGSNQCSQCGAALLGPPPQPTPPAQATVTMPPNPAPSVAAGPQAYHGASGPQTCGLAIASLVFGLLSGILFIFAPIGIILGIVALRKISRNKATLGGEGLAIAGITSSVFLSMFSAIILAILLPVFATARERARMSDCSTNLKQIGTALLSYAQDYDEHLPDRSQWEDATQAYIANPKVYVCPDLTASRSGYAWNEQLSSAKLERVQNPAYTISAFDATGGWNQSGGMELIAPRHNGNTMLVVSFVDGHVKVERPDPMRDNRWWSIGAKSIIGPEVGQNASPAADPRYAR